MLRNYWLIAIRKMWKHKVHSVINVLGLTIGLASWLGAVHRLEEVLSSQ